MKIKKWHIAGAAFTIIVGTLLHFAYGWSNENAIVGLLGPVNESTWEHLKLVATPMLFFAVAEYLWYGKEKANFVCVRAMSIIIGMLTLTALFYTYTGIIGNHFLVADISTFVLGVAAAYRVSFRLLQTDRFSTKFSSICGWILVALIAAAFIAFTTMPPNIKLFADPVTGAYGI